MDLGIEVILSLFSKQGLSKIFMKSDTINCSENSGRIAALWHHYEQTVDDVVVFLQGRNPTIARLICSGDFLPEASRFNQLDDMDWAFGSMGIQDKAKHLATLYLEDLSDFIQECVDEHFGFSRYAERLGQSANAFDELYTQLNGKPTPVDEIALEILKEKLNELQPQLVCFSVPFPGNLYAAFKCAQWIKAHFPDIEIAMGGGFPNTELRSLTDPRVFEFFDYITLDDGELPIELLCCPSMLAPNERMFKRTWLLENNQVTYKNNSIRCDYKQDQLGTPDYSDLLLDRYISVIEIANPMHSLWSDGRWNKLTMAHGCYWGKCTFCDVSLDYIKQYEPIAAKVLVDRMEEIIAQTGENGFHFVDEAAPPALMRELAIEILRRRLIVSWWTNIRFEKSFSLDLCTLLKESGCIAVSGGLEVASDRLLVLIQKGVTVEQVAQVTRNFMDNGIMVHAYLMYGYPTQTIQETIDSLEMVRQLFEAGVLQSGFWHQFALTAHSPIGMAPEEYGIKPKLNPISFANNDIQFEDSTGIDHDQFSFGLKKSLFNFMHGMCFDFELHEWFDFEVPDTTIEPDFIMKCLDKPDLVQPKPSSKLIWLAGTPIVAPITKSKKGVRIEYLELLFHGKTQVYSIELEKAKAEWLITLLSKISKASFTESEVLMNYGSFRASFEMQFPDFDIFWHSEPIAILRQHGFLVL